MISARMLDWAVALGFGVAVCLLAPLRTALEFGMDDGFELMKGWLVSLGHPLYREVWNDQPPLHTEVLGLVFRLFGPSAYAARLLTLVCAGSWWRRSRGWSARARAAGPGWWRWCW